MRVIPAIEGLRRGGPEHHAERDLPCAQAVDLVLGKGYEGYEGYEDYEGDEG